MKKNSYLCYGKTLQGMNEIWKPIIGFEDAYEVSTLGRVRSVDRIVERGGQRMRVKGKMRVLCKKWSGHLYVTLRRNGETINKSVHRLVAEAFIPNPLGLPEVNHKDEKPWNNSVDNLEWCDRHYNVVYGTAIQRRAEKVSTPVAQYTRDGVLVARFKSAREAERVLGIKHHHIMSCVRGDKHYHTAGGYRWEAIAND